MGSCERAPAVRASLNLTIGQLLPRRVVAEATGHAAGEPAPAERIFIGHGLRSKGIQRSLEKRRAGRIPLRRQNCQTLEEEIAGERGAARRPFCWRAVGRASPVRREHGFRNLARTTATSQAVGEHCGRESLQVGFPRKRRVKLLEPLRGGEQHGRRIAAASHGERNLCPEQLRTRLLKRVERPRLRHRQQVQRRVGRAGLMACRRRCQRPTSSTSRVGRELSGLVEEGGSCSEAPARPRTPGRPLELPSDLLVERRCRMRAMPGASVGIDLGISGIGERAVRQLARAQARQPGRPLSAPADDGTALRHRTRSSQQQSQVQRRWHQS